MGPNRGSIEFSERPHTTKIITIRKCVKREPRAEEVATSATTTRSSPLITRSHLANRFLSNWMAQNPPSNASVTVDDSLTDLKWLMNLDIKKLAVPTQYNKKTLVDPNTVLNIRDTVIEHETAPSADLTPPSTPPTYSNETDYSADPTVKPPYSYAQLIYMAMKETNKSKMVLSSIYNWITENFVYYRIADPSWQNSIRHTLSLNKCFEKVARRRDEPGKGGYWRINPEYSHMLDNASIKRRTCGRGVYPISKRFRGDDESSNIIKIGDSDPHLAQYGLKESDNDDSVLSGVSWSSIMNQDIEVGGVRIKTEKLLDGSEDDTCNILPMSPPPSESDDMGIDEFFADFSAGLSKTEYDCQSANNPLNLTVSSDDPLNLTVNTESITSSWFDENSNGSDNRDRDSGLHTPRSESPLFFDNSASFDEQCRDFPWLNDIAAAFDIDTLVS